MTTRNKIKLGTVFRGEHYDQFKKKMTKHRFIVYGMQSLNEDIKADRNVYAFIVTSNNFTSNKQFSGGAILFPSSTNGLVRRCHVRTDLTYVFPLKEVEESIVGCVSSSEWERIVLSRHKIVSDETTLAMQGLIEMNATKKKTD